MIWGGSPFSRSVTFITRNPNIRISFYLMTKSINFTFGLTIVSSTIHMDYSLMWGIDKRMDCNSTMRTSPKTSSVYYFSKSNYYMSYPGSANFFQVFDIHHTSIYLTSSPSCPIYSFSSSSASSISLLEHIQVPLDWILFLPPLHLNLL